MDDSDTIEDGKEANVIPDASSNYHAFLPQNKHEKQYYKAVKEMTPDLTNSEDIADWLFTLERNRAFFNLREPLAARIIIEKFKIDLWWFSRIPTEDLFNYERLTLALKRRGDHLYGVDHWGQIEQCIQRENEEYLAFLRRFEKLVMRCMAWCGPIPFQTITSLLEPKFRPKISQPGIWSLRNSDGWDNLAILMRRIDSDRRSTALSFQNNHDLLNNHSPLSTNNLRQQSSSGSSTHNKHNKRKEQVTQVQHRFYKNFKSS